MSGVSQFWPMQIVATCGTGSHDLYITWQDTQQYVDSMPPCHRAWEQGVLKVEATLSCFMPPMPPGHVTYLVIAFDGFVYILGGGCGFIPQLQSLGIPTPPFPSHQSITLFTQHSYFTQHSQSLSLLLSHSVTLTYHSHSHFCSSGVALSFGISVALTED